MVIFNWFPAIKPHLHVSVFDAMWWPSRIQ